MTYSTLFPVSKRVVDDSKQRIFAPVCGAMIIHTMKVGVNGQTLLGGFFVKHPWVVFDHNETGYKIAATDEMYLEVNYFYKSDHDALLSDLVDGSYSRGNDTKCILSK